MSNEFKPAPEILYEDADCVVVNKPTGLMVHSDGRASGPFLADWVVERYPEAHNVGDPMTGPDGAPLNRAGIVHRLDRDTSGALIIAKTAAAHAFLKTQFQDRSVAKKYLAFVWGEMKEEFGTISRPIGRSGSDFRKWSAQRGTRGETRHAETYWTRLWTGTSAVSGPEGTAVEKFSLILAEPKTGRTHQIRVHMNAVHHPVVGDALYAPKRPMALGFARLALHSEELSFTAPSGAKVSVRAPLPLDFSRAYADLGIPRPKS